MPLSTLIWNVFKLHKRVVCSKSVGVTTVITISFVTFSVFSLKLFEILVYNLQAYIGWAIFVFLYAILLLRRAVWVCGARWSFFGARGSVLVPSAVERECMQACGVWSIERCYLFHHTFSVWWYSRKKWREALVASDHKKTFSHYFMYIHQRWCSCSFSFFPLSIGIIGMDMCARLDWQLLL